jgi:hypothetical protein
MNGGSNPLTKHEETGPSLPGVFFKYCSDDERVIKGIFEDHKIRFTQPWVLNDPLEANPTIRFKDQENYRWFVYDGVTLPSREWWIRLHLIERKINEFGILSLTEIPDSFDMWSRYANGHKGFLFGLKKDFNERPCMLSRDGKPYPVREVEYPPEHSIDIEELMDRQGRFRRELAHQRLFFQKVSRWQTECEYWMVRPFSDLAGYRPVADKRQKDERRHLFDFSLDCVLGVTLGACMSVENKRRISKVCESSGIPYNQAWIVRDERERDELGGKMGKVQMGPPDQSPRLIEVSPCILDSAHIEDQENKSEIASLSQLPYWKADPAWVTELYENRTKRQRDKS